MIELMAVMAIIAVMTSISLISMTNNRTDREVETAAREVMAVLKEAQNNALTGRVPAGVDYPCVYTFRVTGTAEYEIAYSSHTQGEICSEELKSMTKYELKNNVSFAGESEVSFVVPHGNTGGGAVIVEKNGVSYSVTITSAGQISDPQK